MTDRQSLAARMLAETRRRLALPSLARTPGTRSFGRRPRLGHGPRLIDGDYRSVV